MVINKLMGIMLNRSVFILYGFEIGIIVDVFQGVGKWLMVENFVNNFSEEFNEELKHCVLIDLMMKPIVKSHLHI